MFGVDLVEWMIRQAAGEDVLGDAGALVPKGAAIEARLYAENPGAGFRPSAGRLTAVAFPARCAGRRLDRDRHRGHSFYDPMLAKIIVVGGDARRGDRKTDAARSTSTVVAGIETNLDYLRAIAASDVFRGGEVATSVLERFRLRPAHDRCRCAGRADRHAGIAGPACISGMSACRRAGRWTSARSASPTALSAMPRRRGAGMHGHRADLALQHRCDRSRLPARDMRATLDGAAVRP